MTVVKFTRMMAPYCSGDIAGLSDEKAEQAIARGYAVKHDPKAEERREPREPHRRQP